MFVRWLCLVAVLSIVAAEPVVPKDGKTEPLTARLARRVTIAKAIDKGRFKDVLSFIGDQTGLTFRVVHSAFKHDHGIDAIDDQQISLPVQKSVRVDNLLEQVLHQIEAGLLVRADTIEITTVERQKEEIYRGQAARIGEPLVHAVFVATPLAEVFHELTEQTDSNITFGPNVEALLKQPVTARLLNAPLDSSLRAIAAQADLRLVQLDNVYLITTVAQAKALQQEQEAIGRRPRLVEEVLPPRKVN